MNSGDEMEKGELDRLLGKVARLHWRRSYNELMKHGITRGQPRILRYLELHEGCIQRELCDNCFLEPASVSSILEKMEREGMIERRYKSGNHRSIEVFLTQRGHECISYVKSVHQLLEDEYFDGFSRNEKEQVADYLKRILDNMRKTEEKESK